MRETTFPYFIKGPKITNSVIKITIFPYGGISKILGQKYNFWTQIPLEGKNGGWITGLWSVKKVKQNKDKKLESPVKRVLSQI